MNYEREVELVNAEEEELREKYSEAARDIGDLVGRKQFAYGDSFGRSGQILRILYPNGIAPDQLDDALTVTRIIDKLFRVATKKDAFGESPWNDIMGYALLAVVRDMENEAKNQTEEAYSDSDWRKAEHDEAVRRAYQEAEHWAQQYHELKERFAKFMNNIGPFFTIRDQLDPDQKVHIVVDGKLLDILGIEPKEK